MRMIVGGVEDTCCKERDDRQRVLEDEDDYRRSEGNLGRQATYS